jgi:hypothetical protein
LKGVGRSMEAFGRLYEKGGSEAAPRAGAAPRSDPMAVEALSALSAGLADVLWAPGANQGESR